MTLLKISHGVPTNSLLMQRLSRKVLSDFGTSIWKIMEILARLTKTGLGEKLV
jgi:hypothetical protein